LTNLNEHIMNKIIGNFLSTGADRRGPAQTGADRRGPAQTGYFQSLPFTSSSPVFAITFGLKTSLLISSSVMLLLDSELTHFMIRNVNLVYLLISMDKVRNNDFLTGE